MLSVNPVAAQDAGPANIPAAILFDVPRNLPMPHFWTGLWNVANSQTSGGKPVPTVRKKLSEDGTLDRIASHIQTEKTLNFLFDKATKVTPEAEAEKETESQPTE